MKNKLKKILKVSLKVTVFVALLPGALVGATAAFVVGSVAVGWVAFTDFAEHTFG